MLLKIFSNFKWLQKKTCNAILKGTLKLSAGKNQETERLRHLLVTFTCSIPKEMMEKILKTSSLYKILPKKKLFKTPLSNFRRGKSLNPGENWGCAGVEQQILRQRAEIRRRCFNLKFIFNSQKMALMVNWSVSAGGRLNLTQLWHKIPAYEYVERLSIEEYFGSWAFKMSSRDYCRLL